MLEIKVEDGDIPLGITIVFRSENTILFVSNEDHVDTSLMNQHEFLDQVIAPMSALILERIRTTEGT